jgi:hypothetical protein
MAVSDDGWVYALGQRQGQGKVVSLRWKLNTGEVQWLELPTLPGSVEEVMAIAGNGAMLIRTSNGMVLVRGGHVAELPVPDGLEAWAWHMDEFGTTVAGQVYSGSGGPGKLPMAVWTC